MSLRSRLKAFADRLEGVKLEVRLAKDDAVSLAEEIWEQKDVVALLNSRDFYTKQDLSGSVDIKEYINNGGAEFLQETRDKAIKRSFCYSKVAKFDPKENFCKVKIYDPSFTILMRGPWHEPYP